MLAGENQGPMFETLVKGSQEPLFRTSLQPSLDDAMAYSEGKPGIIAIREVGNETEIWRRESIIDNNPIGP